MLRLDVRSVRPARDAIRERDADRRHDEYEMDDGLPHHAAFGVVGRAPRAAEVSRLDEGPQQMYRRDADDRHRKLDLENAGVDMAEPFRLVGMALEIKPRHEGL